MTDAAASTTRKWHPAGETCLLGAFVSGPATFFLTQFVFAGHRFDLSENAKLSVWIGLWILQMAVMLGLEIACLFRIRWGNPWRGRVLI